MSLRADVNAANPHAPFEVVVFFRGDDANITRTFDAGGAGVLETNSTAALTTLTLTTTFVDGNAYYVRSATDGVVFTAAANGTFSLDNVEYTIGSNLQVTPSLPTTDIFQISPTPITNVGVDDFISAQVLAKSVFYFDGDPLNVDVLRKTGGVWQPVTIGFYSFSDDGAGNLQVAYGLPDNAPGLGDVDFPAYSSVPVDGLPVSRIVNMSLEMATISEQDAGTGGGGGAAPSAATRAAAGIAELATPAEAAAGNDDLRIVTPLGLRSAVENVGTIRTSLVNRIRAEAPAETAASIGDLLELPKPSGTSAIDSSWLTNAPSGGGTARPADTEASISGSVATFTDAELNAHPNGILYYLSTGGGGTTSAGNIPGAIPVSELTANITALRLWGNGKANWVKTSTGGTLTASGGGWAYVKLVG